MGFKVSQHAIFHSQARLLLEELSYIQISCWSRGAHRNPSENKLLLRQRVAFSNVTLGPISKNNTQLIEHEGVEMVPTWKLHTCLCFSLFGAGKYSAGYQKRNVDICRATKLSTIVCPTYKIC